jgi:hypothetical protein
MGWASTSAARLRSWAAHKKKGRPGWAAREEKNKEKRREEWATQKKKKRNAEPDGLLERIKPERV